MSCHAVWKAETSREPVLCKKLEQNGAGKIQKGVQNIEIPGRVFPLPISPPPFYLVQILQGQNETLCKAGRGSIRPVAPQIFSPRRNF
jgi:hypothetical protein